jgi:hypothetical protein
MTLIVWQQAIEEKEGGTNCFVIRRWPLNASLTLFLRYYPSMPLGLAGLRELIRRPPPPAVRPFYSNFDWLD